LRLGTAPDDLVEVLADLALASPLKRGLATYRLVFGRPRQADLLALLERSGLSQDPATLARRRIDLAPP